MRLRGNREVKQFGTNLKADSRGGIRVNLETNPATLFLERDHSSQLSEIVDISDCQNGLATKRVENLG